jgi:hypothetical protein
MLFSKRAFYFLTHLAALTYAYNHNHNHLMDYIKLGVCTFQTSVSIKKQFANVDCNPGPNHSC